MRTEDPGTDLRPGDTVWAKFTISSVDEGGDALCLYHPRPGHREHAARRINAIFLWRESDRPLRFDWRKAIAWSMLGAFSAHLIIRALEVLP